MDNLENIPGIDSTQTVKNEVKKPKKKSKTALLVIMAIIFTAIVCVCAYLIYDKATNFKSDETENNNNTSGLPLLEQSALIIGNELYGKATNAYWCNFEFETENMKFDENVPLSYYRVITNYNEIAALFTGNEKEEFETNMMVENLTQEQLAAITDYTGAGLILITDDKVYGSASLCARGSDMSYKKTILEIKSIETDTFSFTTKSYYCDLENDEDFENLEITELWDESESKCIEPATTRVQEKDFVVKRVNDSWTVEDFTLAN